MCVCMVTRLDSLLEEVLDFCCPQSTIARRVHLIKHQLVLGESHSQHTSIIVLQQERGLQCAQTSTVSNLNNTDRAAHQQTKTVWELYHVLKLNKGNVSTVISIIVVKGISKLCLRQPILQISWAAVVFCYRDSCCIESNIYSWHRRLG